MEGYKEKSYAEIMRYLLGVSLRFSHIYEWDGPVVSKAAKSVR